jgi:hypothetical protein
MTNQQLDEEWGSTYLEECKASLEGCLGRDGEWPTDLEFTLVVNDDDSPALEITFVLNTDWDAGTSAKRRTTTSRSFRSDVRVPTGGRNHGGGPVRRNTITVVGTGEPSAVISRMSGHSEGIVPKGPVLWQTGTSSTIYQQAASSQGFSQRFRAISGITLKRDFTG